MAHKTLIGGTSYEVSGGKTLVDGTAYSITGGRTLVDGTGYDISLSKLISFTIEDVYGSTKTYQAEPGMTWNQWLSSSYNTDGFAVEMGGQKIVNSVYQNYWLIMSIPYGQFVYTYDTIAENGSYFWSA